MQFWQSEPQNAWAISKAVGRSGHSRPPSEPRSAIARPSIVCRPSGRRWTATAMPRRRPRAVGTADGQLTPAPRSLSSDENNKPHCRPPAFDNVNCHCYCAFETLFRDRSRSLDVVLFIRSLCVAVRRSKNEVPIQRRQRFREKEDRRRENP